MADLTRFKRQLDHARANLVEACEDPKYEFLQCIKAQGYKVDRIIAESIQRCSDPTDNDGKQSGWYFYNEIADTTYVGKTIGFAVYGSWKIDEKFYWSSRSVTAMNKKEREKYDIERQNAVIRYEREKIRQQSEGMVKAQKIWESLQPAAGSHPYLVKKGIKPHIAKQTAAGALVLPVYLDEQICSLQYITPQGDKKFLKGGRLKDGYCVIEGTPSLILVCEGFSTGASLAEATRATVYVAFSANNLYSVVAQVKRKYQANARIILCADDDHEKENNTGRNTAQLIHESLNVQVVYPMVAKGAKDFNDMAKMFGHKAVREIIVLPPKPPKRVIGGLKTTDIDPPERGFLRDVYDYFNATSGNDQKGFAMQTALALASVVLSRRYRTVYDNYTSLYFLCIAKSTTGKEHVRHTIRNILSKSVCSHLIAGDGYTSQGAVMSTLMHKPRHVTTIDEFGLYLKASRIQSSGGYIEANTKLMEVIGANHSIMRPTNYSGMTLKKDQAKEITDRVIRKPAITLVAMTTPDEFYKNISQDMVQSGFLGRFVVSISEAKRSLRKLVPHVDPPETIFDWIAQITSRCKADLMDDIAEEDPHTEVLNLSESAKKIYYDFAEECIDRMNQLDFLKMSELAGRSAEFALRIALICALAENPAATEVGEKHMAWSTAYIRNNLNKNIQYIRLYMYGSDFQKRKHEGFVAIQGFGENGASYADLARVPPFVALKPKETEEVLDALIKTRMIFTSNYHDKETDTHLVVYKAEKILDVDRVIEVPYEEETKEYKKNPEQKYKMLHPDEVEDFMEVTKQKKEIIDSLGLTESV